MNTSRTPSVGTLVRIQNDGRIGRIAEAPPVFAPLLNPGDVVVEMSEGGMLLVVETNDGPPDVRDHRRHDYEVIPVSDNEICPYNLSRGTFRGAGR